MTATVGGLLERFHALTGTLHEQEATPATLQQDWRVLARGVSAALGALPVREGSALGLTRDIAQEALQTLSKGRARPSDDQPSVLEQMGLLAGAVADVLVAHRRPFTVARGNPLPVGSVDPTPERVSSIYQPRDPDNEAAGPLQYSLLAGAWEAARWSLGQLEATPHAPTPLTRALLQVALITENAARHDPHGQRSHLDHLAVTTSADRSLEGAVQRWGDAAEGALQRRQLTTGSLAMVANDLAILGAALLRVAPPDPAGSLGPAIATTARDWKRLAAWPADLRLEGARPQQFIDASRDLRAATKQLLYGPNGWLPAGEIRARYQPRQLDTIAYTITTTASRAGTAFSMALRDAATGQGRLWRSVDSALQIDPAAETTRQWQHPKRLAPTTLPLKWVILTDPGDDARAMVDQARTTAALTQQVSQTVTQLLTEPPSASVHETIPSRMASRREAPQLNTHPRRPISR